MAVPWLAQEPAYWPPALGVYLLTKETSGRLHELIVCLLLFVDTGLQGMPDGLCSRGRHREPNDSETSEEPPNRANGGQHDGGTCDEQDRARDESAGDGDQDLRFHDVLLYRVWGGRNVALYRGENSAYSGSGFDSRPLPPAA